MAQFVDAMTSLAKDTDVVTLKRASFMLHALLGNWKTVKIFTNLNNLQFNYEKMYCNHTCKRPLSPYMVAKCPGSLARVIRERIIDQPFWQ